MPGTKPDDTKPDDLSQLNFAVFATQGGGPVNLTELLSGTKCLSNSRSSASATPFPRNGERLPQTLTPTRRCSRGIPLRPLTNPSPRGTCRSFKSKVPRGLLRYQLILAIIFL